MGLFAFRGGVKIDIKPMKFKTAKQAHAYADVMNKLRMRVEEVFWVYEKRLHDAGGMRRYGH